VLLGAVVHETTTKTAKVVVAMGAHDAPEAGVVVVRCV